MLLRLLSSMDAFGTFMNLLANIGTTVRATMSEASRLNATVSENCVNICPMIPSMNSTGRKTAIVVSVDAVIAPATSFAPSYAASFGVFPRPRWRLMFSITTMLLSTSMPTPSARPPIVSRFNVKSEKYIRTNVKMTEYGIAMPMMIGLLTFLRNKNNTAIAKTAPRTSAVAISLMERLM